MDLSDTRLIERLCADLPMYARHALTILDKSGKQQRLILNRAQQYIHDRLEKQLAEQGRVRALIKVLAQLHVADDGLNDPADVLRLVDGGHPDRQAGLTLRYAAYPPLRPPQDCRLGPADDVEPVPSAVGERDKIELDVDGGWLARACVGNRQAVQPD